LKRKLERKTQAARIPCVTYTVDYLGMDCKVGEIILLYTKRSSYMKKKPKKLQAFFFPLWFILRSCLFQ
jgi:hypothetical protein